MSIFVFIALVMFRVYVIIYRKTQKVGKNGLIEMKIYQTNMGITGNFYMKRLI